MKAQHAATCPRHFEYDVSEVECWVSGRSDLHGRQSYPRLSDITTTAVKNAVEYFFQQEKKKKNLTTLSYHAILQSHPIYLSRNFKENPLS